MTGKLTKIVLFVFLLIGFNCSAQTELKRFIGKYPDEPFIYIKKQEKMVIQIKDCGLDIESEHYVEKLSLQNTNQNYSDEFIGYSSFSEISNIEAYYLEPKENKYQKTKIKNIVTASPSDNSVFFDDYSHKRVVFPNLYQGCKSILSYKERIKDPHLVGIYMFTGFIPVEYSELSVLYPKEVNISYKVLNDKDSIVKISILKEKSKTILKFSVTNYKPEYSLNNDFSSSYYLPHVIIYINNYTACGKSTNVIENIAGLYDWYYNLTKDINSIPDKVKILSDSLTNGIENNLDKLKTIFYWVQDNIKYVAFEDGYEGFIPRSADKVMIRKYGDCKDMANLTTQLLNAAGIKAYLTWVGTRSIPYSYNEIPTSITDNHMICTAELDGNYYFLDATDYLAFDFPSESILSKEVMIGKGKDDFEIIKIPEISYNRNTIYDSLQLYIENNTLYGKGSVELAGYYSFDMSVNTLFSNKENEEKIILNHVGKGSDKFHLENYELINFTDREKNNIIKYSFNIPDYIKLFDDKIYVNLNLSTPYSKKDVDTNEKLYAILIDKHALIKVKNELQIPKDYNVSYLPDPVSYTNDQFGFSLNYLIEKEKVIYNFELYFKTLKIDPVDFNKWNQMIKTLNQSFKKSIELTKIK